MPQLERFRGTLSAEGIINIWAHAHDLQSLLFLFHYVIFPDLRYIFLFPLARKIQSNFKIKIKNFFCSIAVSIAFPP